MPTKGLLERLENGGNVIMAEGFVFEFERRGYLRAGPFTPEVVLDYPHLVKSLSEEYVHAGSEVVLAFTYYGHREKLRLVGKEDVVEKLNREALRIAKEVAVETGTMMAGNICNTTKYRKDSKEHLEETEAMFKEQIEWSVDAGADFILAETFVELGEAKLALESIQKYGKGLPSVVNINPIALDKTLDGVPYAEACRQLELAGADVVGVNCCRGPATTLPLIKELRQACKGPIAALPVPYRTSAQFPTMQSLIDPFTEKLTWSRVKVDGVLLPAQAMSPSVCHTTMRTKKRTKSVSLAAATTTGRSSMISSASAYRSTQSRRLSRNASFRILLLSPD